MKASTISSRIVVAAIASAIVFAGKTASAASLPFFNGFEGSDANAWLFAGNAGVDRGLGNAMDGANNGWVNATSGWNAVNIWIPTSGVGAICNVKVWIRTSSTLTAGYISVNDAENNAITTVGPFGQWPGDPNHDGYNFVPLQFTARDTSELFYVGLWGNGQASWIQVDDLSVSCLPRQLDYNFSPITFSGGTPVGGSAHITVFQDGTSTFSGGFHDSGATSYSTKIACIVKDAQNRAYLYQHQGQVNGTFESGSRDDDWDNAEQANASISGNWADLASGGATSVCQSSVSLDLGSLTSNVIAAAGTIASIIAIAD